MFRENGAMKNKLSFVNQFCASSGDSELGRVSSGWITNPSLSKFGGN